MALLDPKLDVVFKLPFAEPRNRSLLAAVLRTTSPIAEVTVLEPELPKDLVLDRGVRLDLLVQLEDGRLVDVEMQCDPRGNRGDRWLTTGLVCSRGVCAGATSRTRSSRWWRSCSSTTRSLPAGSTRCTRCSKCTSTRG